MPDRLGDATRPSASNTNVTVLVLANSANSIAIKVDWRIPLITYLHDPCVRTDRSIQCIAFKYVLIDGELYCRTPGDVTLNCLAPDDATLAMNEIHEGIYGTHRSAQKMKWLLRRVGFD